MPLIGVYTRQLQDDTSFFKQKAPGARLHLAIHVLRLGLGNVRATGSFIFRYCFRVLVVVGRL